jgi:hypothetical protein
MAAPAIMAGLSVGIGDAADVAAPAAIAGLLAGVGEIPSFLPGNDFR